MDEQTTTAHVVASIRDERRAAPTEDPILALARRHALLTAALSEASDEDGTIICHEIWSIEGRLSEMVPVSLEGAAAMLDIMLVCHDDFGNGDNDLSIALNIQTWFAANRAA